jgi:prepilin-type processing-associated H-X9-DG protein
MEPARKLFEYRQRRKEMESPGGEELERLAKDAASLEEISGEFEIDPATRRRAEKFGLDDVVQELELIEKEAAKLRQETKRSIGERVGAWMKQSTLFKMALVSAALHVPLSPTVHQCFSDLKEWIFPAEGKKEKDPRTVLRPQSYEEMLRIENETAKRKQRIKPGEVDEKKADLRERLARGETVSFKEMYLDMEQVNGEPAEAVATAKEKAEQRIEKYANEFGKEIDRNDLRTFVSDMYGADANYVWGQGSVTKFFNTGMRNCLSAAKGQLVVLEGVISRMPAEESSRYALGISKLHQHEVATLTVTEADGGLTTYFLEGNVMELRNTTEIAGTKTVSLDTIKQAMVSEKPIHLQAKEGQDVKTGPDIIASVNQPVDDGIRVDGELAGSEYVLQEAAKQGVRPEIVQEIDPNRQVEMMVEPEYIEEKAKEEKWIKEGKDPKVEREKEEKDQKKEKDTAKYAYLGIQEVRSIHRVGPVAQDGLNIEDKPDQVIQRFDMMKKELDGLESQGALRAYENVTNFLFVDGHLPEFEELVNAMGAYKRKEIEKGAYNDSPHGNLMLAYPHVSKAELEMIKGTGIDIVYLPEVVWTMGDSGPIPGLKELDASGVVVLLRSAPYDLMFTQLKNAFPDLAHFDVDALKMLQKDLERASAGLPMSDLRTSDFEQTYEAVNALLAKPGVDTNDDEIVHQLILKNWSDFIEARAKASIMVSMAGSK